MVYAVFITPLIPVDLARNDFLYILLDILIRRTSRQVWNVNLVAFKPGASVFYCVYWGDIL